MSKRAWFRSLYSRIALGFVALLAVLLLAQGLLFLWLTGRFEEAPQGRTAQQLADFVARELSDALAANASLNLDTFIRDELASIRRPFLIVMRDGRRASNRPSALPRGFMERGGGRGGPPPGRPAGPSDPSAQRTQDPSDPRTQGPADPRPSRGRRGGGPGIDSAPVVVNGQQVGTVAVPPNPPAWMAVEQYAPTLALVGVALLISGATVAALLIFRPAHNRLRSLEEAARALGEGRTDVRASESGGDEVSTLAHAFNTMAKDLHERASALAASDQARRQLLADVSHELMTPLTAIRGYMETLSMPELALDPGSRRRYFEVVNHETYKLESVIGDLLDVARLEGGGETLAMVPVSVDELFRRVVERHHPVIHQKNIAVTVDIHQDAGEVLGDAQRLEQALQNLAANAIRHIPDGGSLTLRAEAHGDKARIVVQDNGPGIPPEHLPHVFDRFYKADASRAGTTIPSGSGLGLSIVQTIVQRHGGEVHASNASGGGAIFEIALQLCK